MNARAPVLAYVGVGSNLDEPRVQVQRAFAELRGLPDTTLSACSALYASAPVDASGPDYVNAVAALQTTLPARQLLHLLHDIETRHGRVRSGVNAPRTLDLDLLLYGTLRSADPALQLPHPRLHQRAFVLQPLLEIAPQLCVEGLGPLSAWLDRVRDQAIRRLPVQGSDR